MMYSGCIIKESINDELILDLVEIVRTELWKTNVIPKYWTAVFFETDREEFPQKLSEVLTGNWYVDMKVKDIKIIVFKNKVMEYRIGDAEGKKQICDYCISIGIPKEQLDWPE